MARTIAQIQASIISAVQGNAVLGPLLTSTSNVAVWLAWTYIIAVCQWTIENLFDQFTAAVNAIIAKMRPHTLQWYATIAKQFQYGCVLPPDTDTYDNSALTAAQVAATQIVAFAACAEIGTALRLKVAKLSGTTLVPLDPVAELPPFAAYMALVKDAGVPLNITSGNPDRLVLSLTVYYDPLVLSASGQRLDTTDNTPVEDAITNYINNLPFNGLYINTKLGDAVEAVSGVYTYGGLTAQAMYGAEPLTAISLAYTPDAGYMSLDIVNDLTLTFVPYGNL
jgi:hypothetical protein